jgi:hypothetical protein
MTANALRTSRILFSGRCVMCTHPGVMRRTKFSRLRFVVGLPQDSHCYRVSMVTVQLGLWVTSYRRILCEMKTSLWVTSQHGFSWFWYYACIKRALFIEVVKERLDQRLNVTLSRHMYGPVHVYTMQMVMAFFKHWTADCCPSFSFLVSW